MVTFKENYEVRIEDETPYSSGMFTFLKGRSYDAVYKKKDGCTYLFIYSFDHKVDVMFNKIVAADFIEKKKVKVKDLSKLEKRSQYQVLA